MANGSPRVSGSCCHDLNRPSLSADSVVQIGAAYWLYVPLGKLRTDRYIPLHPQLKQLLDDWVANRPTGLRSPHLFIEHGRRIRQGRVDAPSPKPPKPPGSATSPRTGFGTPWPPKRSTGACPSKRLPPFSGTDPCG